MAVWPTRTMRVVLCGVVLGALVVGAISVAAAAPGVEFVATSDEHDDNETAPNETAPNETATNETIAIEGFDRVQMWFEVAENGSAEATIEYRFSREGNESTERWESLESDIEENPEPYVVAEAQRWNETVERAKNLTNREMNLSSFAIETDTQSTPREQGIVIVTFEWSSFATVEPRWIEAGDALDEFSLDDGTSLWISWPEGYELRGFEPNADELRESAIGWNGAETDFIDGEPRVELLLEGEPREQDDADDSRSLVPWLLGGLVILGVAAGVGWWFGRLNRQPPGDAPAASTADVATTPPPDLMSNEERVLTLLAANGGRIKQQNVVAELEWTEAKTSQVVGALRDDGEVEVFRVGRENVITLPDHESVPERSEANGGR